MAAKNGRTQQPATRETHRSPRLGLVFAHEWEPAKGPLRPVPSAQHGVSSEAAKER